jgi:hypothetical protein
MEQPKEQGSARSALRKAILRKLSKAFRLAPFLILPTQNLKLNIEI